MKNQCVRTKIQNSAPKLPLTPQSLPLAPKSARTSENIRIFSFSNSDYSLRTSSIIVMETTLLIQEIERLPLEQKFLVIETTLQSIKRGETRRQMEYAAEDLHDDDKNDEELVALIGLDDDRNTDDERTNDKEHGRENRISLADFSFMKSRKNLENVTHSFSDTVVEERRAAV
jgi:hypothetical protein